MPFDASQICLDIKEGGGKVLFDDVQKVPYYVKGSLWIGYDNERSLRIKVNVNVILRLITT